ncbi:hypothetical protein F2P81_024536 [Scophthalmus maximus]|uniref:Uncharacterized protein n=1 Tax=Scophthalmus maximus TaxID=52904 RepID=A0A6A4RMZ7_SCOMX|nr:hypothetical protein F2P81_024536 [Scophthalmus maximus]
MFSATERRLVDCVSPRRKTKWKSIRPPSEGKANNHGNLRRAFWQTGPDNVQTSQPTLSSDRVDDVSSSGRHQSGGGTNGTARRRRQEMIDQRFTRFFNQRRFNRPRLHLV